MSTYKIVTTLANNLQDANTCKMYKVRKNKQYNNTAK